MKEKITNFFNSEGFKKTSKKIFNKKTFIGAVIIVVIAGGLKIGYSLMFEVNGVVSKIDGNKITLVTFINTQTVDTGNYTVDSTKIKVGDRIEIVKNLSGQVIYIQDRSRDEEQRTDGSKMGKGQGQVNRGGQKKGQVQIPSGTQAPRGSTSTQ